MDKENTKFLPLLQGFKATGLFHEVCFDVLAKMSKVGRWLPSVVQRNVYRSDPHWVLIAAAVILKAKGRLVLHPDYLKGNNLTPSYPGRSSPNDIVVDDTPTTYVSALGSLGVHRARTVPTSGSCEPEPEAPREPARLGGYMADGSTPGQSRADPVTARQMFVRLLSHDVTAARKIASESSGVVVSSEYSFPNQT